MAKSTWCWSSSNGKKSVPQPCCGCLRPCYCAANTRRGGNSSTGRRCSCYIVLLFVILALLIGSYLTRTDLLLKDLVVRWNSQTSTPGAENQSDADHPHDTTTPTLTTNPNIEARPPPSLWSNIFTSSAAKASSTSSTPKTEATQQPPLTTKATNKRGKLLKEIFPQVKTKAQDMTNLIYQRYEFHHWEWFQFFLISWNISQRGWDILQYKLMKKLLYVLLHEVTTEEYVNKMSTEDERSFRMIFSGSSVTAGYDNHFHDSYPYILEKRLKPIFELLHIPLTIRNIAQYRVDCRLTNYCIPSMAGDDIQQADVISWENTFSCGKATDVTEFVARLASFYGAVAHYATSGGYSPAQCPPSKDAVPWIAERWNTSMIPSDERVPDYIINEEVIHAYRQTQNDWYEDGHAVSKFVHAFDRGYQGVAPHGFNNWAKSKALCKLPKTALVTTNEPGCEAAKVIEDLCGDAVEKFLKDEGMKRPLTISEQETIRNQWRVERRPHWMVMEASFRGDGAVGVKTWHPPYAMHLLRGELLTFNYIHILLAAMMQVEKDLSSAPITVSAIEALLKTYNEHLQQLQIPIPKEPLFCQHWECHQKPRCFAHFGPLFGKDEAGHIITKSTTYTLKTLMLGEPDYQWMLTYLPYYAKAEENGYIDEKFVFMVEGPNRRINFRLWNITMGVIKVYGVGGKYRIEDMEFYLDPHVNATSLDSQAKLIRYYKYSVSPKAYRLTNLTYVLETDHYQINDIPQGDHVLAVKTPDFHKVDRFTLSHIIIF